MKNSFNGERLTRDFYFQDMFDCMKQLLGKVVFTNLNGKYCSGRIIELEGYLAPEDKASHAYLNKVNRKNAMLYSIGGISYVYNVHLYYLLNVTVGNEKTAQAILIRAMEPVDGIELMSDRRGKSDLISLGSGPGKMCISMGINRELNGADLVDSEQIGILDDGVVYTDEEIVKTKRVGIDYAEEYIDKPWRWYVKDSKFVSKR